MELLSLITSGTSGCPSNMGSSMNPSISHPDFQLSFILKNLTVRLAGYSAPSTIVR